MRTRINGHALTRRQALGIAGVVGAAYVAGPLRPFGAPGGAASDPDSAASASCVLAPEVTEGPYWVETGLRRSNVIGGQAGVTLNLNLYVYRSDDSCEPQQGAIVDIWHCNASGLYSDEAVEGTSGQTWLRGNQETNADGLASFTTIYPGWYVGRAIHIHVRVRTFSGSATTYNFTTQIFFSESDNAAVLATSHYSSRGSTPDTANSNDMIYQQEAQAGNVLQPTLSGSASAVFSGTVGIGLSGLPATPSDGSSSDLEVEAKLLSWHFRHSGGRRELKLKLRTEERIAANAQLVRAGRVIAHKRIGAVGAGRRNLVVPIANDVPAGVAGLKLTLTDRGGNKKTIGRKLALPTP